MSDYTKSTNFATKDNLTPGDPLKIVRGTEIDTEFNNIATAIATKTDNASAAITGGSITGITDLAIADGGTGASTANAALNNLLPSQASASGKYLKSNGTDSSWDALDISTADITGTLPVANGGTGVTSSTGTGSVVLSNSPTLVTPALGTPASGVATNLTGLPLSTGVTGTLPIANGGTGQTTANAAFNALAPSQATASGKYLKSDGTNTSWDALDISTADITGTLPVANGGTGVTSSTGTGSVVLSNSPTLVTPALGTPSSATLTNATGLPISTGVSGLGTGVATALAVNVGSAGAPVVNGGALGTPSSGTVTNLTGTASININGTVGATTPTTGAFTTTTVSTSETLSYGTANGVTYLNGSKVLTSGSALTFDGTRLNVGGATNTYSGRFITLSDSTNGYAYATDNTVYQYLSAISGGVSYVGTGTNHPYAFSINGSEQMRLTSTGLGIGTSSPTASAKLELAGGNLRVRNTNNTASSNTTFWNGDYAGAFIWNQSNTSGTVAGIQFVNGSSANGNAGIGGVAEAATPTTSALAFYTGGSGVSNTVPERARIDSAGNVFIAATSVGAGFTGPQLVVGKSANPYGIIEIQGNKSGSDGASGLLMFYNSAGSSRLGVISAERTGADNTGALVFTTFNAGTGGEVGRFNSTGALVLAGGASTANGTGITFPATQNASSNANTLDDYEEGTWTPAWSFSTSGSVTLSITGATYTKVGRLVTVQCRIFTTAISSPSGNATLTGLPFTNGGSDTSASIGLALRFNNDLPNLKGFVTGSAATISLQTQATNGASETSLTGANFGTAGGNQNIIAISATYFV